ncbi:hypothetical protein [Yoonia sp.]|uniref:hypothetical protein n=1 Tax=Yoonia sp. TaxID=2212373 RepID=UPI003F6D31A7
MASLPLYLEFGGFRAIHACWDEASMQKLKKQTLDGTLTNEQLCTAADQNDPLFDLVETAVKGPGLELRDGLSFLDKAGHERTSIRRKWWNSKAKTWREVAISVPDLEMLPDGILPEGILQSSYPTDASPVFFGHYWMEGTPHPQADNALCLDYSAGKDGPLVSEARKRPRGQ